MSGELTTFEKNYQEWKAEHPTRSPDRWVVTTGRREAARFISEQANKIREAQFQAADDIITSQEQTRNELKAEISSGVDDIVNGLEGMKSTFEWGFSELVWQIEKQRGTLQEILETLQKPLDTQAKELKKRAERAYENGWFDDALQDFLESEKKSKYDFTVHQNLGNIYFFHKAQPDKALKYYEKAAKYAKPESAFHASFALLHVGLIEYLRENFNKAYEATSKAIELSPELQEARYEHAKYCTKVGEYEEALGHLKTVISNDRYYAVKANLEEDFNVMKPKLLSLFGNLRDDARNQAKLEVEKAEKLIQYAESHGSKDYTISKFEIAKETLEEAGDLYQKNSLFDYVGASHRAKAAQKIAKDSSIKAIETQISEVEREHDKKRRELQEKGETLSSILFFATIAISSIGSTVSAILMAKWSEADTILGTTLAFVLLSTGFAWLLTPLFEKLGNMYVKLGFKKYKERYKDKLRKLETDLFNAKSKEIA